MLEKLIQSIKSAFTTEIVVEKERCIISAPELTIVRKKHDNSVLSTFQLAAGYAALMKYREDKLLGKANDITLDDMFTELNQRLGTNKSRTAWSRALKKYSNTIQNLGE